MFKTLRFHLFAGVPVVIVGVAASVHPTGYGTSKMYVCHLQAVPTIQKNRSFRMDFLNLRFPREGIQWFQTKNLPYPKIMSQQSEYISSSLPIRCWLSTEDQFIWVFLAPVVAVIVVSKDPIVVCITAFFFTIVCMFHLIKLNDNFFLSLFLKNNTELSISFTFRSTLLSSLQLWKW